MNVPVFDDHARANARQLLELALREDLDDAGDLTSHALIDEQQRGHVSVVVREPGIVAGLPIINMVFEQLGSDIEVRRLVEDGTAVEAGVSVAEIRGPLRTLLTGERTAAQLLDAPQQHRHPDRTLCRRRGGTAAQILDTRKTLPGWRNLQKYAVRAGGGTNHRIGLYDGVLIKDNHLAGWAVSQQAQTIAAAIQTARASVKPGISIEVEVDTLEQLQDALDGPPDIVLLDNMSCDTLRRAVELRNQQRPGVQLEASGGVTLETVAQIAATGVERISIGALTHSAIALDLAFDWSGQTPRIRLAVQGGVSRLPPTMHRGRGHPLLITHLTLPLPFPFPAGRDPWKKQSTHVSSKRRTKPIAPPETDQMRATADASVERGESQIFIGIVIWLAIFGAIFF